MKDKILYHGIPIVGRMPLFTAEMRQAIRDDRKGQTRRLNGLEEINEDPGTWQFMGLDEHKATFTIPGFATHEIKLPWHIGDVRCMCEPLVRGYNNMTYYRDDSTPEIMIPVNSLITGKPLKWRWQKPWLASIHMPTEAARTVCRITDIRVEPLQRITPANAKAEGCLSALAGDNAPLGSSYLGNFQRLWDSINAKKGYGWDVPQMVWVNVFEKLEV